MNMIYQPKKIAILRDNQHNLKSTRNQQCVLCSEASKQYWYTVIEWRINHANTVKGLQAEARIKIENVVTV